MSGFMKAPTSDLATERRRSKALGLLKLDLRTPFTADQVRSRFRELVTEAHPDSGGVPNSSTNINDLRNAKDFLVKYAGEPEEEESGG